MSLDDTLKFPILGECNTQAPFINDGGCLAWDMPTHTWIVEFKKSGGDEGFQNEPASEVDPVDAVGIVVPY